MSRLVVCISHVEFTDADQTLYVIKVTQDADEWAVRRSYTDFRHLRDDVHRVLKDERRHVVADASSEEFAREVHALAFPSRRLFGSKREHVVKERAVELHHFLIRLLLLTHSYRKAQKAQYDRDGSNTTTPSASAAADAADARVHGSAAVFFLLRDFLKPARIKLRTHSREFQPGDEDNDEIQRILRESKMLTMRTSQQNRVMSAPELLAQAPAPAPAPAPASRRSPPPPPPPPMPALPAHLEGMAISGPAPRHVDPSSLHPGAMAPSKTVSIASLRAAAKQQSTPELSTTSLPTPPPAPQAPPPVLHSIGSEVDIIATTPDVAVSPPSSSTSRQRHHPLGPVAVAAAGTGGHSRGSHRANSTGSNSSSNGNANGNANGHGGSARRRPRLKHKSSSASSTASSSKSLTSAEREQRHSERLTRLNPQLTAQSITIDAQKELERHMSEYNAIMVLRYVDRFISKAITRTPGCYTVVGKRLVIDSARFVEELEEVFTDLPDSCEEAFKSATGDWLFPKALDTYVQMKWNSFQGKTMSANGTFLSSRASDSEDDSDSEYEYQDTGGFMRSKPRAFTEDESDVLQKMIAEGTASRDEMLRLRRQFDERGWQRRPNPRALAKFQESAEFEDVSDTDDDESASGTESFKQFQARQNAMRKSRLSQREDRGGLV